MPKKGITSLDLKMSQEINIMSGPPNISDNLRVTLTNLSNFKEDIYKLNERLKQSRNKLRKDLG